MADILTSPHAGVGAHHEKEPDYIEAKKGLWSWMSTVDHKRLGLMYLWAVVGNFILGGIFALLVRITLLTGNHGDNYFISAELYNRFFTLHGIVMVFLVIIPSMLRGSFAKPVVSPDPEQFAKLKVKSLISPAGVQDPAKTVQGVIDLFRKKKPEDQKKQP